MMDFYAGMLRQDDRLWGCGGTLDAKGVSDATVEGRDRDGEHPKTEDGDVVMMEEAGTAEEQPDK